MDPVLQQEIERLRKMKLKELKLRYRELFGEQSPSSNHRHLFRRIAWRMQAQSEGDLSERARERAAQLAEDVDLRLRAPRRFWKQLIAANGDADPIEKRDSRIPSIGTVLRRTYRGATILVTVREDGFEHDGRIYGSLSAVALRATGTRWNGFLFFGLMKNGNGD
jgi:hypothetical protein